MADEVEKCPFCFESFTIIELVPHASQCLGKPTESSLTVTPTYEKVMENSIGDDEILAKSLQDEENAVLKELPKVSQIIPINEAIQNLLPCYLKQQVFEFSL